MFRLRAFAIIACCAIASGEAAAQAMTPLRVDPTLLGLPPVEKQAPKPSPARPSEPERVRAEIQPVEAPAVEQKPIAAEPAPPVVTETPTRTAEPTVSAGEPVRPAAAPMAPAAREERPVAKVVAPTPAVTAPQTQAATAAPSPPVARTATIAPPPVAAVSGEKVTTLGPLRVHPGLLGLPVPGDSALAAAPAAQGRTTVTPVPAPGATPAAALAVLEKSQHDTWRAGTAPVLAFPSEDSVLPADTGKAPALRLAQGLKPLKSEKDLPRPMFLSADEMSGITDREAVAQGNAEARKQNTVVTADRLTYWPLEDELEAKGNVRMVQNQDVITGPRMKMKLEAQTGFFEQPNYFLKRDPKWAKAEHAKLQQQTWALASGAARRDSDERTLSSVLGMTPAPLPPLEPVESHGKAERMDFEGENRMRVINGDYTTCKPGSADWYVKSEELALDYDRGVGEGKNGTVYFKDVPILYSPWLSFSLNNERKSGFLAPTMGATSNSGLMVSVPYYWNIAPNMDMVVASRAFSKRGVQIASDFRYIDHHKSGQARVEAMPSDNLRDRSRYGFSLLHNQTFGRGFSGALNLNGVSDDHYFTDLSSRSTLTSQTQLLRQGTFSYGSDWWNANVIAQGYQTLQPDPAVAVVKPYSFAPQVNLNARRPDFYTTDVAFLGQYTSFAHSTKDQARRLVAYPQISLPVVTPGYYVTPKIGVHMTDYSLERRTTTGPDSISRTLPIFSVDAGMTFERDTTWFGAKATQTLEPRLYYLNVPYRDQSQIPIFDSALADFNFAQIFSENQYVGYDRIADANQLTAALVSRLIDPATGAEAMRGMVGQRYYFRNQQTTLPSQTLSSWNKSDLLAAFSGRVWPKTWLDTALQYSPQNTRMERFSVGARYQPELGKVLNVAYRYNRDSLNLPTYNAQGLPDPNALRSVDIAGQWPLWGGWSAVGRYNYSLKDKQPVETLGGLEYNAGCWAVRAVAHQLATISGKTNTAFFIQLELTDFARIGSNPIDLLKRNVQGYGLSNQPAADPVFGQ